MKKKLNNIKVTGFKTPDNYFDAVEENIFNTLNREISIAISKETGFKTPSHYFDGIEEVIINKTERKNTPKVISIFSKRNLLYVSSIAAAVLIFFNLSIFDKKITFDSLDTETVENYILYEDYSAYEIASLFSENDLLDNLIEPESFSDDAIETYIIDHLDIESLIIE